MPCYHPREGYRSKTVNPSGKRSITFNAREAYTDLKITIACGQCIGCRLERSRQWAVRCVHEASLYSDNCFITLTYSDEFLPKNSSLDVTHFQKFMKRLRRNFPDRKIRFFHCGEYGESTRRPHYHACLFNLDFPDKIHYTTRNDNKCYRSATLEKLWPFGQSMIGNVTFESAAYVARYITTKVTGPSAIQHYQKTDPTGVVHDLKPEYTTMSRCPGIARDWYEKYKRDVYPHGFVEVRGVKQQPPKFYDRQFEIDNPARFAKVKARRALRGEKRCADNSHDRLKVRKQVKLARIKLLKRDFSA